MQYTAFSLEDSNSATDTRYPMRSVYVFEEVTSEWIDETVPELMDDARWSASEEQLAMAIAQRIQRCHDTYVMVESVHWYESEVEEWTASRPSCVAGIWRTLKMRPKGRK
jgi:hypothetical protein